MWKSKVVRTKVDERPRLFVVGKQRHNGLSTGRQEGVRSEVRKFQQDGRSSKSMGQTSATAMRWTSRKLNSVQKYVPDDCDVLMVV